RSLAILRRYAELIGHGITAAIVWLVLQPLLLSVSTRLFQYPGPTTTLICVGVMLFPLAIHAASVKRWWAWLGVRHFAAYPPWWVGVTVALVTLAAFPQTRPVASAVAMQLSPPMDYWIVGLAIIASSPPLIFIYFVSLEYGEQEPAPEHDPKGAPLQLLHPNN